MILENIMSNELSMKIYHIKEAAARIWQCQKLRHFTKHGIEHSEKIIKIMKMILSSNSLLVNLNEHEKFILFSAAYLHDIGMQSAFHAGLPDKDCYNNDDAEVIRENHHISSAKMIEDSINNKAERTISCGLDSSLLNLRGSF